ncbi:MAG: M50 family metallopeptidase [Clostridia bacterium]|nr:M50 family metallopeptidase [Clostridia bacterium]
MLLLAMTVALAVDASVFSLMIPLTALIHEAGHYTAIRQAGGRVEEIRVDPCGVTLVRKTPPLCSYWEELWIHLSGPSANCLAAMTALWIYALLHRPFFAPFFIFCNLALATVNLLPVRGTDGGGALEALLLLQVI